MNQDERRALLEMHDELLERWGVDARAVLWRSAVQQERRFAQLVAMAEIEPGDSVLDIGCGVGHLHDFLRRSGWRGDYLGIDLHAALVDAARARWTGAGFRVHDIAAAPCDPPSDWGLLSGLLNYPMADPWPFLVDVLAHAFASVRKGLVFNFISDADHPHRPQMSYYPVGRVVDHCARHLSHDLVLWTQPDDFNVSVGLMRPGAAPAPPPVG